MDAEVAAQVGHLDELAVAMTTLVRFLASVESHVSFQVVVPGEALLTNAAFERFFTCVSTLVVLKYVLVPEGTITNPTCEHFVPTCYHFLLAVNIRAFATAHHVCWRGRT